MTKNNQNVLYFFATLFVSVLAFGNTDAEVKAKIAEAKAKSDAILQNSKAPTTIANAQFQFCKTGQKLLDVQEGAARKKTDRQTIDERASILSQIYSLLVVENILAEIEQQKKLHEAAQQAEALKQGQKYKKQPFKEIFSFNCKEMVGPENNLRDQKPTGREFNIEEISKAFRNSYDKNAIAKLPAQPKRGKAAVVTAKVVPPSVVQQSGINPACKSDGVSRAVNDAFYKLPKTKAAGSKGNVKQRFDGQVFDNIGTCKYDFTLERVADKIFVIDHMATKKIDPPGEEVSNPGALLDIVARTRVAAPAVVPVVKPDGKKGTINKAGAGT